MQFNAMAESNHSVVRIYRRLGFDMPGDRARRLCASGAGAGGPARHVLRVLSPSGPKQKAAPTNGKPYPLVGAA